ncbi:MAG: alpha/beta hydrolase [Planctomycetota bacterium]
MAYDYFVSVRNISMGDFGSEPSTTRFLSIPEDAPKPLPEHAVRSRKDWVTEVKAASANEEAPVRDGDILVYVHGYNNHPRDVLRRHRMLKRNLDEAGYRGAVVSFDWPSNNVALNYLEDRSDARKTAIKLVDDCIHLFVRQLQEECVINLHLLAHSTGAYVVREAFDDADDRRNVASTNWSVSQVALIAADISSKSMREDDSKSSSLYRHCVRLTNYQNPYDSVLKLSNIKRVGVAPRAGRIGLPEDTPRKAVNVNCGPYFAGLSEDSEVSGAWDHSWHFNDQLFIRDLAGTIRGNIDREYLPTRRRDSQLGLMLTA